MVPAELPAAEAHGKEVVEEALGHVTGIIIIQVVDSMAEEGDVGEEEVICLTCWNFYETRQWSRLQKKEGSLKKKEID